MIIILHKMSYKLFADSIQNFSDLESFCKVYKYENESKCVYSYDKSIMNRAHPSQHLYRSIVIQDGEVVSFASPKMSDPSLFSQTHSSSNWDNLEFTNYVEGTMINLYYDKVSKKWELATKRMLGGMNKANVDSPTFKELFDDTCKYYNLNIQEFLNDLQEQALQVCENHNKNRNLSFSFVMNHPLNYPITFCYSPSLVLTDIYSIGHETSDTNETTVYSLNIDKIFSIGKNCGRLLGQIVPKTTNKSLLICISELLKQHELSRSSLSGIVIRNVDTNERTKMFTNGYRYYKMIKGNYSRNLDRFIDYSKEPTGFYGMGYVTKLDEFLGSFPEYYNIYNHYYQTLCTISRDLLQLYFGVNVYHSLKLSDCDKLYKNHIYKLHGIYLNKVKNNLNHLHLNRLTQKDIYYYLINLPIGNIIYLLKAYGVNI